MDPTAQIIIAIGTCLSAVFGGLAVLIGAWNARNINRVHDLTNHKMNELVELTRTSAIAKGNLEGRAEQAAEMQGTIEAPPR